MSITRASTATVAACVALLCIPAAGIAADPSDSSAGAVENEGAPLARGAGYAEQQGDRRVRALQRRLRALGQRPGPVDGIFGPRTEAAVERVQGDSGLPVDGIVGPQTRRVLNAETPPLAPGAGYGRRAGSLHVRAVQRRLRALGLRPGPIDGLYGPRTRAAIERFQRTAGEPASGVLSAATATALRRADGDPPSRRASDPRREREPTRPDRRPATRPDASGTDSRSRRVGGSAPSAGPQQSSAQTQTAVDDRTETTDGAESRPPLLLALPVLALAAIGIAFAVWLKSRRSKPGTSAVGGGPVRPAPRSTGGSPAPKPSPGAAVPSSREPGRQRSGAAALGYVSVRAPGALDGREVRDQIAAIDAACRERGLELRGVIRDLEQVNDTGPARPGITYALRRLTEGQESCLVVAELGRLSHSARDVGNIVDWLRRKKARLVAVGEGLDTGTKSGGEAADKLVLLGASARPARPPAQTGASDPVARKRPTERRNDRSRPAGHASPELGKRIRAMREAGMTLQAIADRLNAENVPTLRGGTKWRPSAVQAATGYRRPGPKASPPANGAGRNGNGSSGGRSERARRRASGRKGGRA
jgi:peptidoglycan hydrolase-like protein with peptidoglycan-binding domain/DNA invertase Pin-like site-specific DNA recombinase